ncbi:hypothetical protein BSKO_04965 [Bryopsis sp. KO-2023]|nr:hypothetical protein BSKO_04965 [Bryopsis sp. KO-2023]
MVAQLQSALLVTWALTALSFSVQCHGRSLASEGDSSEHLKAIGVGIFITRNNGASQLNQHHPTQSNARRKLQSQGGCSESDDSVNAVLECTNSVRQNPDKYAGDYPCHYDSWRHEVVGKNYPPLKVHGTLTQVAQLHSDDQARLDQMSHSGSDGSSLGIRVDRAGFDWGKIGENVAVGYESAKEVVMAWMCSPTHRKNVMNCNYNLLGIGCSWSQQGSHYYTQNFGCAADDVCECGAYHQPSPEPYFEPYMDNHLQMFSTHDAGMYRDQSNDQNNQWVTESQNGLQEPNNNHLAQVDELNQGFSGDSQQGDQPRNQRPSFREQFNSCAPGDPNCSRMQMQTRAELRTGRLNQMEG